MLLLGHFGPIEKIPIQANLDFHTGSPKKNSSWSGVRFRILLHFHYKIFLENLVGAPGDRSSWWVDFQKGGKAV